MGKVAKREQWRGVKFNRLLIIEPFVRMNDRGVPMCRVRCNCGTEKEISLYAVRHGQTKSCGCLLTETRAALGRANTTHGLNKHPLHKVWAAMMRRCHSEKCPEYPNYGGRGITVCEEWHDIRRFVEDMDNRPTPDHTLDRIDNNSGYSKDNCRWVTRSENCRNQRTNQIIEAFGRSQCLAAWADEIGVPAPTIRRRLDRLGWDAERAVGTPLIYIRKRREVTDGEAEGGSVVGAGASGRSGGADDAGGNGGGSLRRYVGCYGGCCGA